MSGSEYDPRGRSQAEADRRRSCLVTLIDGRVAVILPLDPLATDEQIAERVSRVARALDSLREN